MRQQMDGCRKKAWRRMQALGRPMSTQAPVPGLCSLCSLCSQNGPKRDLAREVPPHRARGPDHVSRSRSWALHVRWTREEWVRYGKQHVDSTHCVCVALRVSRHPIDPFEPFINIHSNRRSCVARLSCPMRNANSPLKNAHHDPFLYS